MTDSLPAGCWKLLYVTDHAGNLLLGKFPDPEPNLRAEFVALFKRKGLVPEDYT